MTAAWLPGRGRIASDRLGCFSPRQTRLSENRSPMPRFSSLAINDPARLHFGVAPHPLTTRKGMTIGGGLVYPEINFTLPAIDINAGTMPEIIQQYRDIIAAVTHRAIELEAPGLVVEFETLPPMTL